MQTRVICLDPNNDTYYLAYCEVPQELISQATDQYRTCEVPDSLVARYELAGSEWASVQSDLAVIFAESEPTNE